MFYILLVLGFLGSGFFLTKSFFHSHAERGGLSHHGLSQAEIDYYYLQKQREEAEHDLAVRNKMKNAQNSDSEEDASDESELEEDAYYENCDEADELDDNDYDDDGLDDELDEDFDEYGLTQEEIDYDYLESQEEDDDPD